MSLGSPYPAIVLFSFFPWEHEYPSTAHGLARALARHTRVVFVSKPPTLKDIVLGQRGGSVNKARVRAEIAGHAQLSIVDLPAVMPINGLPPGGVYEFWRKLNDRRLNRELRDALIELDIDDFVWINLYAPTYFVDLDLHRAPLKRFYYGVDAIDQTAYTKRHGVEAEKSQLLHAHAGLATSTHLADSLQEKLHVVGKEREVHLLPNAMEAELYNIKQGPEPAALEEIPQPRAVYLGNLDDKRIDYEGLVAFAKTQPTVQVVMIGPWNGTPAQLQLLSKQANIYLLGRVAQKDCAAVLAHCQVGLIPFRCTPLTAAIYPLKINEYLALGLPVLSTPFSADILSFSESIELGNIEEWPAKWDAVLHSNSPDLITARQSLALSNTWANRADSFLKLLDTKLPSGSAKCYAKAC